MGSWTAKFNVGGIVGALILGFLAYEWIKVGQFWYAALCGFGVFLVCGGGIKVEKKG